MNKTNKHTYKGGKRNPVVTLEIEKGGGDIRSLVRNKINVIGNNRVLVDKAIKANQPIPIFKNLMPIVYSLEVLQLAYNNIKSNKGSMTKGTIPVTADEMSTERIKKLSKSLKDKTFKFPAVRRTYLPKPGKKVQWTKENLVKVGRPLGMPDFDSKIVQESIRLVLNGIYEPLFDKLNTNHGFREGRGCHDAIKNIPSQTQGMELVIEGDIKGAFPSLDHEILIQILKKRIDDPDLLDLIYNCCKAGIFDEFSRKQHDPLVGVPQGGIVSPLLWNIYMHEFDKYVLTDIQSLFDTINKRQNRYNSNAAPNSLSYRKLLYRRTQAFEKLKKFLKGKKIENLPDNLKEEAIKLKLAHRSASKKLLCTPSKDQTKIRLRFWFVRYADDWVFFTNAKFVLAQYVKNKIASFLKYHLKLTLADDKTKITRLSENKAKFLGFSIFRIKASRISLSKFGGQKRTTNNKVCIGIDKDRVIDRLTWKGYLDKKRKPRELPALSVLSDYEIVMRYNSSIRGYVNYYAPMIDERSDLNYFVYILEYSCYKTLCQKHRTTIRKLLKPFKGNPLTAELKIPNKNTPDKTIEKSISLLTVKSYWPTLRDTVDQIRINLDAKTRDQTLIADGNFITYAKGFWRTKFKFEGRCVICGSHANVQMHHIKKIGGLGPKAQEGFSRIMALLNRKQVPVCKFHHDLIHAGKYDGANINDLYDVRIAQIENELVLWDPDK